MTDVKTVEPNYKALTLRSCSSFFAVIFGTAFTATAIDTVTIWLAWAWLHQLGLLTAQVSWPGAVLAALMFNYSTRWRITLSDITHEDVVTLTTSVLVNWLILPLTILMVVALFTFVAARLGLGL